MPRARQCSICARVCVCVCVCERERETKPDSRGDWVTLLWRLSCVSLMLFPHFRDWLGCQGDGDARSNYNPHRSHLAGEASW